MDGSSVNRTAACCTSSGVKAPSNIDRCLRMRMDVPSESASSIVWVIRRRTANPRRLQPLHPRFPSTLLRRAEDTMAAERAKLLVVDDDHELRELAQAYLTQQGFEVATVPNGPAMDAFLAEQRGDLVLLDLMLPGEDGLSIARRLKQRANLPIIMISAQGEDVDRIVGLEIGADDYIAKPFNPRELLARIRAVLRRANARAIDPNVELHPAVQFGEFELDLNAHRLSRRGVPVVLTSGE